MTDKKHVPILPCPFCGYTFSSVDLEYIDEAWKDDFVVDTFDGIEYDYDNDLYYINCPGCGAAIEKTDIASTICSWNTRSLPAAASDPLQNLPAAASDPLQKKLISIPFFSEYAAANIAGTKKSTIRDRILCEPGDVFFCKGALFEITSVRWIPDLETACLKGWRKEGFSSYKECYEELSKIYPLPERERKIFYLYTYRKVGGDYLREVCP